MRGTASAAARLKVTARYDAAGRAVRLTLADASPHAAATEMHANAHELSLPQRLKIVSHGDGPRGLHCQDLRLV
jgi:hypothetical protein